jgi:hypothetical protein
MVDFCPVNGNAFKIAGVPFYLSDLDVNFFKTLYREVVGVILTRVKRIDTVKEENRIWIKSSGK